MIPKLQLQANITQCSKLKFLNLEINLYPLRQLWILHNLFLMELLLGEKYQNKILLSHQIHQELFELMSFMKEMMQYLPF